MKDIKFRIPHTLTDNSFSHFTYWGYLNSGEPIFSPPMTYFTLFSKPSEQYTGLKDKNGKEIYEGDIVNNKAVVKWIDVIASFMACITPPRKLEFTIDISDLKKCEVTGNIHENPELLS